MNDAVVQSIEWETKAIMATQETRYDDALNLFGKAIDVAPLRASVYNNRAQTMRLLNDDAGKHFVRIFIQFSVACGRERVKSTRSK